MRKIKIEDLKQAKIYFGHRTFKWNPKAKPYIFKKQFGIYFIDLEKTKEYLEIAMKVAHKYGREGKKILWVGTKKQAAPIVKEWALKTGCNYIDRRWLAGVLTNFQTISKRLHHMEKLDKILGDSQSGDDRVYTKKEKVIMSRELEKLQKNLLGLKGMKDLPDMVFVIDISKETLAVKESRKIELPIMAIVDTNVDPTLVAHRIPGNDDSIKSIEFIVSAVGEAYLEGLESYKKKSADDNVADSVVEIEEETVIPEEAVKKSVSETPGKTVTETADQIEIVYEDETEDKEKEESKPVEKTVEKVEDKAEEITESAPEEIVEEKKEEKEEKAETPAEDKPEESSEDKNKGNGE